MANSAPARRRSIHPRVISKIDVAANLHGDGAYLALFHRIAEERFRPAELHRVDVVTEMNGRGGVDHVVKFGVVDPEELAVAFDELQAGLDERSNAAAGICLPRLAASAIAFHRGVRETPLHE